MNAKTFLKKGIISLLRKKKLNFINSESINAFKQEKRRKIGRKRMNDKRTTNFFAIDIQRLLL